MNIQEATTLALAWEQAHPGEGSAFLMKRDRSPMWCLFVATGLVYRSAGNGDQVGLDAEDCLGTDWYVVDKDTREIAA